MSHRGRTAALILPVFLLSACSGGDGADGDAAGQETPAAAEQSAAEQSAATSDAGACEDVSEPLVSISTEDGEPTVELPQPEGWERNSQLDSELVRLTLVNQSMVHDGFAPNVVVTAEDSVADAPQAFDRQLAAVRGTLGEADLQTTPGQLCGHESMTVEYTLPPQGEVPARPALVQMVVVPTDGGAVTYTMTAQSTDPDDEAYQRDVRTMLEGVQIGGAAWPVESGSVAPFASATLTEVLEVPAIDVAYCEGPIG